MSKGRLTPRTALRVALALLAAAADASAQAPLVETYTEVRGLPSSRVRDVRPAPSGRPWFATRAGIFEFDGTAWDRKLEKELRNRGARFLRFDGDGEPWVLCEDGTVFSTSPAAPEPCPPVSGDPTEFHFDFEVWDEDGVPTAAVTTSTSGLLVLKDGSWNAPQGWAPVGAALVVERCFGRLFVGTEGGLHVLGGEEGRLPGWLAQLPAGGVRMLSGEGGPDGEGLWIGGDGWIGRVDADGSWNLVAEGLPVIETPDPSPVQLTSDGLGGALYGNPWGLYHVSARTGVARLLQRDTGFPVDGVNALRRDRDGLVWGASEVAGFKVIRTDVWTLSQPGVLLDDEVTALAQLPDGRIVLGHPGGLTLARGSRLEPVVFDPVPRLPTSSRVMDLAVSTDGELLVAAASLGLGVLDAGGMTWLPIPSSAGAWANAVESDGAGGAYVGATRGLLHYDGNTLEQVAGTPERMFVRRIERTADGVLYVATPAGVWTDAGGGWSPLRLAGEVTGDNAFTCLQDGRGVVWCGTADGLLRVEGDHLVRDPRLSGLERPVYSLVEDARGRLWIGTDFGFSYLDGERLVPLEWLAHLTGYEANRAAALTDGEGTVWLGSMEGVTAVEPTFELDLDPPAVELLAVTVDGEPVATGNDLSIGPSRRDLCFTVRADTLLTENRVEFSTRIVGLTEWLTTVGPTRLDVRHASLPPGDYRFEARARLPGGEFGPVVSSQRLVVLGSVWTRPWFLALMVAVIAGVTVATYRSLLLRRHSARLEREVERRSRELETSLRELAKTDRLRALAILGGGIAHDMRNILTILTGNLSLLAIQGRRRSEDHDVFAAIDHALGRATQLVNQLQTFATGGAPLTRATSLARVIRESGSFVLAGSGVVLRLELDDDLPPAEADSSQIRQVFENLLVNARQSQPEGGWVRVRGRTVVLGEGEDALPAGTYLELVVSDGGPGIAPGAESRIFEPFYTTKEHGTGLGLATALSIVRRHGGAMTLVPSPSSGATFRILLPTSTQPIGSPAVDPPVTLSVGGQRVLVLDDEEEIRVLLGSLLRSLGYDPMTAANEREALGLAREARGRGRPFALAILDLTIPGDPPGSETLARLRELEPGLRAIASSGYSRDSALARHQDHGFDAVLPKPYRLEDLRRVLAAVERAPARDAVGEGA